MTRAFSAILLLVATATTAFAQSTGSYHSGWGFMNSEGILVGEATIAGTPVIEGTVTIRHNGALIDTVAVDKSGKFQIPNLKPALYAIRCDAKNGCGVVSFLLRQGEGQVRPMQLYCSSVPSQKVNEIVARLWSPAMDASKIVFGRIEDYLANRQTTQTKRVRLDRGTLSVQVVLPSPGSAESHSVIGFQDGKQVFEEVVDAKGFVRIPDLKPGLYDIVIAGQGHCALQAEVLAGPEEISAVTNSDVRLISAQIPQSEAPSTLFAPVVIMDEPEADEILPPPTELALPASGAPVGAGFAGGGGGGGAFGGGVLGAAAIAIAAAALADDDDGFNQNASTGLAP
ncbi:MAG: hypothetical protein VXZ82_09405 [Planctomycetota bacterium]|nr:hypothetical protein [Planctomycetota bacterium]